MNKRVWKLQDFVAHAGKAQCARLGEKSGQVLATGGEDKKVNIWKVGKPNAMMSLQGHTSSVECLVFDKQEEVLVVGCGGGAMQVWNLEYRKIAGTLDGHRTACSAVEFHPYGEFFASGSVDTNLKIWDLRRKSCIQTYKGHSDSINCIRFSPHGRWVATGGQDNLVKVWDLTAGKLMRDLEVHKGPIRSVAFHPKEYFLATGSADRTAKLWSLETFQAVSSTELGATPVDAVKFWLEEQSVVSVSQDAVRVYPIDNMSVAQDTTEVDWKTLQDTRLCASEEKMIAVATEGTQCGIWVADLAKKEASLRGGAGYGRLHGRGAGARLPTAPVQRRVQKPFSSDAEEDEADPDSLPDETLDNRAGKAGAYRAGAALESSEAQCRAPPQRGPDSVDPARSPHNGRVGPADFAMAGAQGRISRTSSAEVGPRSPGGAVGTPGGSRPTSGDPGLARAGRAPQEIGLGHINALGSQHPQMLSILQRRLERAQRLKGLWVRGNLTRISSELSMPQDHAVFCGFARAILRQNLDAALNLDACQALLPILRDLMSSKYDDFVTTALEFTEVLLRNFSTLISDTRSSCASLPERQLDLPREDRLRKCNACHDQFREILRLFPEHQLGSRFVGFRSSLQHFVQNG